VLLAVTSLYVNYHLITALKLGFSSTAKIIPLLLEFIGGTKVKYDELVA